MQGKACYRALKISEIKNDTHFELFREQNGELVSYTKGRHSWSDREKEELRQSRQFVLFYPYDKGPEVAIYLNGQSPEKIESKLDLLIHDGVAEFLKTRAQFPATDEQRRFFQCLGIGLSRYFHQQVKLSRLLESLARHDPYSFYQGMRSAAVAVAISQETGKNARLWDLMIGAALHDVGNLTIEPSLLNRAGPLNEAEWKIMRRHTEDGLQLLQSIALSPLIKNLVLQHHERQDGLGYPHRQRLTTLSREVRLLNFADVFAAITVPRAYQKALPPKEALPFMQTALASYIDPEFFDPLARLLRVDQVIANQNAS